MDYNRAMSGLSARLYNFVFGTATVNYCLIPLRIYHGKEPDEEVPVGA